MVELRFAFRISNLFAASGSLQIGASLLTALIYLVTKHLR